MASPLGDYLYLSYMTLNIMVLGVMLIGLIKFVKEL